MIELADKICNLRDIVTSPSSDWNADRKHEYFDWTARIVTELRGAPPALKAVFDGLYDRQSELL